LHSAKLVKIFIASKTVIKTLVDNSSTSETHQSKFQKIFVIFVSGCTH